MNRKVKTKDKKSAKINGILFLVIVLQILFVLRYCNIKSGYFVDEIWSYGLANSYYHAQIWEDGGLETVKIDPDLFRDYLIIDEGEKFAYGSVFYNQTHDSHPPLFYLVLHTISSFFPGEFSKWFGLIPNVLYCAITLLYIYKITSLFTDKKWVPLVPVVWFGFSLAAVNMVTYIRMYMLLVMWATMFAYFHLKTVKKGTGKITDYIFLTLTVFGGLFTHFYFVIFAFPWVMTMLIRYVVRKDWKEMMKYIVSGLTGVSCVCILYPEIIKNVLGSNSGHSASMWDNLRDFGDWESRIQIYQNIISSQMFGSALGIIITIVISLFAVYVLTHMVWNVQVHKSEKGYDIEVACFSEEKRWYLKVNELPIMFLMMVLSTAFYFVIVSKISPWTVDRYMFCVFPFFIIIFSLIICYVVGLYVKNTKSFMLIVYVSVIMILGITYFAGDPAYLFENKANNTNIAEGYSDVPCLYVYDSSYVMVNNAFELMNFQDLYQTHRDLLRETIKEVDAGGGELVIYLDKVMVNKAENQMNLGECLYYAQQVTGLNNKQLLFEDDKVKVYYLSK